ncbi:WPP domain-interacting tail-anchored protein 2-like isoform X2 [Salvia miltiorrhiza]|uniref:WPP domain-interacting tail-anchored protein 2-like isoform X2 n=1 Tax=Salvia miltiorrhiza TaxID=226208 RepID=UPI0025ABEE2C|nr:WPP domain-interacting tail-anchored protein 2-like isoform X2 [Salvia miltiorrhiza]
MQKICGSCGLVDIHVSLTISSFGNISSERTVRLEMDSDSIEEKPTTVENVNYGELEAESNNIDSLEVVSSGGDTMRELGSVAENLTRVELDIACSSEKLINLDILVMHVASRESDFEAFSLVEDHTVEGPMVKALEFDLLYGFLDSEVRVLENFLSALRTEIVSSREVVSSFSLLGDTFIEDKLRDCEDSLKHSFEQVSDLKEQAADFQRILFASSGDEKWKDNKEIGCLENNNSPDLSAKIKMQTAEQQRNILRMLEKSLAREMDLEKKLTESRETEEDLKLRLQQEVFCMEQEAEDMWERLFEAENSADILSGVSKELYGRIQMAQFSINGLIEHEGELRSKLEDFSEQNKKLTEKASEAEKIAEIAEAECKNLRMSNMELNTYVSHLKSSITGATNQVEQLETQLKDSENKRLHAVASAEASQEKQSMLDCTIQDMEDLIRDLKSKVQRAESQTESAEDKCIILSETNADLIDELKFLRRRMEHFETSLHQADEAKKETAKDIRVRTKLITDLVLQLALERERLHKQISSLIKEKKVAVKFLQRVKDPSVSVIGSPEAKVEVVKLSKNESNNGRPGKESNEEKQGSSATSYEAGNAQSDSPKTGTNTGQDDPSSELDTVRNIDARQLKLKYVLVIVLIFVIPPLAAFLLSQ